MYKKFIQYMKNNFSAGSVLRVITWISVIGICLPYLSAQQYALFRADDFSGYIGTMAKPGNSFFEKAFNYYVSNYMGWQGTWSSDFVFIFFNPIRVYSYTLLRIVLTGILLASIISIFFLSYVVMDYFHVNRKNAVYCVGLFLIPLLSYRDYKEIYLWFTGMAVYLLPVLFFAIAFSFLLLGEMKQKKIFFFLSAVFMVLMSGGVLEFVGFGMFWLLLLIIIEYIRTKKINKRFVIIFALSLLGALATAFAPGNFARRQEFSAKLSIMKAAFLSIKAFVEEIAWFGKDTTFIAFVILAFLLGCCFKRKIKDSITATAICGLILTPVVTIFPVALGYGSISVKSLPSRCLFILDMSIIACCIGTAFLVGNKLFTRDLLPDIKNIKFIVCMAVLLVITLGGDELTNYTPIAISANFKNGFIQKYESDWRSILDQIEHSSEWDITVTGAPDEINGCLSPDLTENPEWWTNVCVASFFSKGSVRVVE